MIYENYKTGMFRVCVYLTIIFEAMVFLGGRGHGTEILGIWFRDQNVMFILIPLFIWVTYFFSLWIYKGFLGKK
jgi:hypothetical protein